MATKERVGKSGALELHSLLILLKLPEKKRLRVQKLFELLFSSETIDEAEEMLGYISEILDNHISRQPQPSDGDWGCVSDEAKQTLEAYHAETGRAIRKRREELGLTQEALAELSGLPQSHISRLESGKHSPTNKTIEKIAKALQVEPGQIDLLYD